MGSTDDIDIARHFSGTRTPDPRMRFSQCAMSLTVMQDQPGAVKRALPQLVAVAVECAAAVKTPEGARDLLRILENKMIEEGCGSSILPFTQMLAQQTLPEPMRVALTRTKANQVMVGHSGGGSYAVPDPGFVRRDVEGGHEDAF